jgi:flagellar motor protein MotB
MPFSFARATILSATRSAAFRSLFTDCPWSAKKGLLSVPWKTWSLSLVSVDAVDTTVIQGMAVPNYADIGLENELREGSKKFAIIEGIVVSRDERGVAVSLGDTLLFESGTAEIKPAARPLFATLSPLIKQTQRTVIVEGHTDNIPLRDSRFASNMELSAARAAAVFAAFVTEDLVHPDQLSTRGTASTGRPPRTRRPRAGHGTGG